MANQTDAAGVDVVSGHEQVDRGLDVPRTVLDGRQQAVAGGAANAPVVESQGGDTKLGQMVGEHGEHREAEEVGVPVLVAAAADQDNGGMRPVALGEGQLAGQHDLAVGEHHDLAAIHRVDPGRSSRVVGAFQPECCREPALEEFAFDHPAAHLPLPCGQPER